MTIHEIETLCVKPFTGQARSHRERLFYGLEDFYQRLLRSGVCCEMIVDGSFLTEKPFPMDVDVKVYIDVVAHNNLNKEQLILLNEINFENYIIGLDSSAWVTYPIGHPDFGSALDIRAAGEDYGLEHSETWLKGYAVVMLWETDVGVRIRS